jgi:GNAT superfamily N-acetyltransferase
MRRRLTIRPATGRDAVAVRELLDVLGYPMGEDGVRTLLGTAFREPRHAVVVAEVDAVVVGLLVMAARPSLCRGGWVATLEALVVRPDRRRRGVGEALLQYAKGLAAEQGFVRLELEVAHVHAVEAGPFLLDLGLEPGGVETFCWGALEPKHPRVPVAARPLTPAVV